MESNTFFDFNNELFSRISIFFKEFTSRVLSELPSEKDISKNFRLKNFFKIIEIKNRNRVDKKIEYIRKITIFNLTAAVMPIVMAAKYTDNSRGERTGFLNLTIDKAPTIPRESAIFPEIIVVIMYVIIGKSVKVAV